MVDAQELQRRIQVYEGLYSNCAICPENCRVDRTAGEQGRCRLGLEGRVYKEFVHFGEEPENTPTHAIYLAGCNFRCSYCSDLPWVEAPGSVESTDPAWLAQRMELRIRQGAESVTFVGGTPDVQPLFVLQSLLEAQISVPVVWNSNLWLSRESLQLLDGIVDVFVPDFKYGPGRCDQELSGTPDTFEHLSRCLEDLRARKARVIVRHLVLPGHTDCCTRPVLQQLGQIWPAVRVNLMTAYRPFALVGQSGPMGRPASRKDTEPVLTTLLQEFGDHLAITVDGQPWEPASRS